MGSFRIRQHVNPLKSDLLSIAVERIDAAPGVALEVELGSAEARFLFERARAAPGRRYVGVEIRREMVDKANRQSAEAGLGVRSVFANMSVDLPRLFADGSVARFHLNFPDPWWKSRQHKRRVVSPELFADARRALAPGGEISMMTDVFDLAIDAMAALESGGFLNLRAPWSFAAGNPFGARSRREQQCESEGTRIWRLRYRKRCS